LAFLFLPITVILFFGSDWVVDFVFGSAFGGSVLLLKIMLPAAYLLGLEVVLAQDIAGRGYPWPAVLMWVPIVILNVVGYLILIPVLGLSGAAISLSVSFVVIFLLIVGYYKRLAHVGISELLIVRREDLKLLHSNLQTVFSQIITPKNKSSKNAVTTFTNQNKTKAQSISS
jgi:O-antigen/teichoic acid export membrane protein